MALSPEHLETRIVRLETRDEEKAARLKELADLPGDVRVLGRDVTGFQEDLTEGFKAIRSELAEIKRDTESRSKERRQMLLALLIAGVGLVGTFGAQLIQLRGGK